MIDKPDLKEALDVVSLINEELYKYCKDNDYPGIELNLTTNGDPNTFIINLDVRLPILDNEVSTIRLYHSGESDINDEDLDEMFVVYLVKRIKSVISEYTRIFTESGILEEIK